MFELYFRLRGATWSWVAVIVPIAITCQSQVTDVGGSTNASKGRPNITLADCVLILELDRVQYDVSRSLSAERV